MHGTYTWDVVVACRLAVSGHIDHSYKLALDSASRFDSLRLVHDFCSTWDSTAYKAATRDVSQFRKDMAMLRSWQEELGRLTAGHDLGCLHVSLSTMQEGLQTTLDAVGGVIIWSYTHGNT